MFFSVVFTALPLVPSDLWKIFLSHNNCLLSALLPVLKILIGVRENVFSFDFYFYVVLDYLLLRIYVNKTYVRNRHSYGLETVPFTFFVRGTDTLLAAILQIITQNWTNGLSMFPSIFLVNTKTRAVQLLLSFLSYLDTLSWVVQTHFVNVVCIKETLEKRKWIFQILWKYNSRVPHRVR